MKKLFGIVATAFLAVASVFGLASCDSNKPASSNEGNVTSETKKASNVKVGFIFLHDENSSYDKNFIDAANDVCKELGVTAVMKIGVEEGAACYDAAAELVDQGCSAVFADSFGHEAYMIQAAKEFTDVQFFHATGTKAHTEKLANYHNAFASIYEGRYIAGIVAGMKLNEMITNGDITAEEAVIGYVGAFPYAEVVSGYTSFYLGAKSVCASATMKVRYTNSWYSVEEEANACTSLIENDKCVLISQHADSQGAPGVCEEKSVPNVFYNGENSATCPNTYLVASRINWRPFMREMINSIINGTTMAYDYCGTIANGAVEVMTLNTNVAAEGTAAAIEAAKAAFTAGTLKVFDTTKFTVKGAAVTTYLADVDDMGDYAGETEVIKDGYFHESEYRSAPYFDLRIDGITEIA